MASLEPPVPGIVAENFDDRSTADTEGGGSMGGNVKKRFGKAGKRTVGLLMLAVVVFLWTASNFLASDILADDEYSKPFFITYVNTAFFVIPLVPILMYKRLRRPEELQQWREDTVACLRYGRSYVPFLRKEGDGAVYASIPTSHSRRGSNSASSELLLGDNDDHMETSQVLSAKDYLAPHHLTDPSVPLSLHETTKLSLEFCMLWFLANYFVAACLEYTTVASSTILTSTSSVFTLLFGALFGVEKFTVRKLIGVLASLAGIVLISSQDLSGESADDEHRGDFPEKSLREIAIGDALAFASAVMYGIYAVFMKKRIDDESRISMPLFFGLVGLINIFLLWPLFLIFHATNVETFAMPPTSRVTLIIVTNSLTSLVSDLCWAYAVLFTSPIVVTVGLSMTIPLSLVGQIVLNGQTASVVYWVGAMVVVLAFVFVNREEKKEEVEAEAEADGGDGGQAGPSSQARAEWEAVRRSSSSETDRDCG